MAGSLGNGAEAGTAAGLSNAWDYAGLAETDALIPQTETGKAYALSYKTLLAPEAGNLQIRSKKF